MTSRLVAAALQARRAVILAQAVTLAQDMRQAGEPTSLIQHAIEWVLYAHLDADLAATRQRLLQDLLGVDDGRNDR